MKQTDIMALLKEAAKPECSHDRLTEISLLFTRSTLAGSGRRLDSFDANPANELLNVMLTLLSNAFFRKRECLPGLFPFFAMVCGDREDVSSALPARTAIADWSLVD